MALLSSFPPFNTAGGGAGIPTTALPSVSTSYFTLPANRTQEGNATLMQLNANQFAVAYTYVNSSNNLGYYYCIPFQVSNTGTITIGTAGAATNSSGPSSFSTTLNLEAYPGETCMVSRMQWSGGTYNIVSGSAKITNSNVATVYFNTSGNDFNNSAYPHPISYIGPSSSPSAATRTVNYAGYSNAYSLGYRTALTATTGNFNFSGTSTSIGSDYSTYGTGRSLSHWSDTTTSRTSYYTTQVSAVLNLFEVHSDGTFSNLGSMEPYFSRLSNSINCFRLSSGKCVYLTTEGNSITTNGTGTLLSSGRKIIPYGNFIQNTQPFTNNYGAVNTSNTFYTYSSSLRTGYIFKITEDSINYNHTFTPLSTFSLPFLGRDATTVSAYIKFAGNSNQFIVAVDTDKVVVYDSSSLILS